MLVVKIVIGALLIFMVVSLFKAMVIMLKNKQDENMSKYIGRRVLASALIIGIILLGVATGLIKPNPSPYQQQATQTE
ncbi:DUF2909 domain-containing protein [Brumicola blandensis]|jgi:dipeptide/tripeptide permease|uniref:DUF2909 domain-containing protein n=1 Tax=Brumicola blandensis TaxID=3075611 RepID=A0AAW8R375_9ALTE|nr:DUF2909 domain-containing protein [Alteromonas sp. W409]MDT0583722.1 DUF2909 domain-containing protein [Alteromonas sp. W409]